MRRAEVTAKAKEYGLDINKEADRLQAAEEVLAVMAQTRPDMGFVKRAVAAIRTWLRQNIKGFSGLKVTDAEIIRSYILPARAFVERGSRVAPEKTALAFSRAEESTLKALSKNDELFALPKSDKTDIQGIADDNVGGIKITKTNLFSQVMYTLTFQDGSFARITDRKYNPRSAQLYEYDMYDGEMTNKVTERPGENPEDAPAKDDVWLDVSSMKKGGNGERAYNIAATYAHNNGKIFIGDPEGLTDAALRRRTEQMISSALKFGTTDHLAPQPRQTRGDTKLGVPPLKWVYGDSVGNIERMIDVSRQSMQNAYPDAAKITYNPTTGEFIGLDGQPILRRSLAGETKANRRGIPDSDLATAEAGWRTVARNAVFTSLLEMESSQGTNRGTTLDRLGRNAARLVSSGDGGGTYEARDRIFYSRSNVAKAENEKPKAPERKVTTDRVDSFNPQDALFENPRCKREGAAGAVTKATKRSKWVDNVMR